MNVLNIPDLIIAPFQDYMELSDPILNVHFLIVVRLAVESVFLFCHHNDNLKLSWHILKNAPTNGRRFAVSLSSPIPGKIFDVK